MNITAVQALVRRLMIGNEFKSAMVSMGGVGSTALARHIGSVADKTVREHAFSPSVFESLSNVRLGYMYGNPYNAVLSVFRRGYQQMHAKAMHAGSKTRPSDMRGVTIESYLEKGVDEFCIERQFDNWTNLAAPHHPIILIKYETMKESIGEVLTFFGVKDPFPVKARQSSWRDQPAAIQAGLERMYGTLNEKIEAMPPVRILLPPGQHIEGLESLREEAGT
jgi:hypothetical protein